MLLGGEDSLLALAMALAVAESACIAFCLKAANDLFSVGLIANTMPLSQ